jgi:hypothetical protein
MMLHITLWGNWCDTILNVHTPPDNKTENMEVRFCEELEGVFDKYPK